MSNKPPLQIPNHVCKTKEAVVEVFGESQTRRALEGFKAKVKEYGNPIERDFMGKYIAPVELRGFGPNHEVVVTPGLHKSIHAIVAKAFNEIYARRLPYTLRAEETTAPTYFRYTKNTSVKAAIATRPEYGFKGAIPEDWAGICARWDRDHNTFEEIVKYKGAERDRVKKDLLSNHSWGTAFDLNPRTNDYTPEARFDMPIEIVKILESYGFYWGGRYHDYMHFEYCLPCPGGRYDMPRQYVCFPFGRSGERESPTKYIHMNEAGRGGFYPLGLRQNLHGGVHLDPDTLKEPPPPKEASAGGKKGKPAAKAAAKKAKSNPGQATPATAPSANPDAPKAEAGAETEQTATAQAAAPAPKPVLKAMQVALPGYVVAARLVNPQVIEGNDEVIANLEGQPLGFVLVRHELVQPGSEKQTGKEEVDKSSVFYSLYMHLAAPAWDGGDDQFERAPWLEKFLRMQFGSVVVLDPDNEADVGKTYWARADFNETAESLKVRGKTEDVTVVDGARTVGVLRKTPDAIRKAIDAFKKGAVVGFDRPVLVVAGGETLGFLGPKSGPAADGGPPQHYLHWEVFSVPEGGLATLRQKAAGLEIAFADPVRETSEDNFLEMPTRLQPGKPDEIAALFQGKEDPVLNAVIKDASYGTRLKAAFGEGKEFAAGSDAKPFHYPITLKLANPFNFRPDPKLPDADAARKVQVAFLQNGVEVGSSTETIAEFGDVITLPLNVPAAADVIRLRSSFFQLQFAPPPSNATPEQKKEAAKQHQIALRKERRALLKAVTGRRWRNIVLDHLNEWTTANLGQYLLARLQAGAIPRQENESDAQAQKRLEKVFSPLTWWAPPSSEQEPHGEHAALGDGSRQTTIFDADKSFLPKDAHIENMHPVTALWLTDLLVEEGAIALREAWPPDTLVAAEKEHQPLFFGVVPPKGDLGLGALITLAVVEHGYHGSAASREPGVAFVVQPAGSGARVVGTAAYVDGAAVLRARLAFWGQVTFKAELLQSDSSERIALKAEKTGQTPPSVPRPTAAAKTCHLIPTAGTKVNDQQWTGTLLVKEGSPWALEGYLGFECWKAASKQSPDTSTPGEMGNALWPVVATWSRPERHERNGLLFEGDFIVGAAPVKGKGGASKPGAPAKARITENYVLQDFIGTKAARIADAEDSQFKVAFPLVERLQLFRDQCAKVDKKQKALGFRITQLNEAGLSLRLTPTSPKDLPALLERAAQLPASDLLAINAGADGKTLELTYEPLPATRLLSFETGDLDPVLHRLANEILSSDGEQLWVRPIFMAPNGGHHAFVEAPRMNADGSLQASPDDLRSAVGTEILEFTADRVLPPVHRFGFGPISFAMGQSALYTRVPLLGPASEWAKGRPRITCTVAKIGPTGANLGDETITVGSVSQGVLSEAWQLDKWTGKNKPKWWRWGQRFRFKVEVTSSKGLASVPDPVEGTFVAEPKLEEPEVEIGEREVVFCGQAHAMPTTADLGLLCEQQNATGGWEPATEVQAALSYDQKSKRSRAAWGRTDEEGHFGARVPRAVFSAGMYRFTWHVVDFADMPVRKLSEGKVEVPILGLQIASKTTRPYSASALGSAVAATEGGGMGR
jgi:hypothetical protein